MDDLGGCLGRLREGAPLVHCITNLVAMDLTANALLALGASPAMVHAEAEAEAFAGLAAALLVNIGTPDPAWGRAMEACAARASRDGRPWVLDPVAAGATPFRRELAGRLLDARPTLVRGNASEVLALAGEGSAGRGTEAGDPVEAARGAAEALARRTGGVVAVTGAVDLVTDGALTWRVRCGHPLMAQVTATGCALGAVAAAFLAVGPGPEEATTAALLAFGLAGERAAEGAGGPGSFRAGLLDALAALEPGDLDPGRVAPA